MENKSPMKGSEAENAKDQLKKKTAEEFAQMAIINRAFSAESTEDPPPLAQKRSESTLKPLNDELKSVPLVRAFNSAENQLDPKNQNAAKK
ncbi:Ovule protein [Caenorhabditis elegans]|uniref:Ovule protein n=1 Tax=Caenorhabditis elegans TaxID=6239 RepID=Q9XXC2_CAEEL|nr:Ovule protein [Caenorhabditis elegans]CAA19540.1 Ovule protein [Caenorhabditis elegans]|eukprot:NP_496006.1 Uncharacterized protein CELE_Y51B9A.5 [Caenorhabditis elegans]